jgi:radical SAM enzyme (TIGR01210 family)
MCDLWKHTTAKTVPDGAIPTQIGRALAGLGSRIEQIKLYNSGSFFDPAAIPRADYWEIVRLVDFAKRVVVESHPRLIGSSALRLRDLLAGTLEVAMGLETTHPRVMPLLNKKFDLTHFSKAVEFLKVNNMSARAFVLVRPPFLDEDEGVEWAVRSAEFAVKRGATTVSLIPTRPGNGAMDRLMESGEFSPPKLSSLERALELALEARGEASVLADTWDLERFSSCAACFQKRRDRLRAMNQSQSVAPRVNCAVCNER